MSLGLFRKALPLLDSTAAFATILVTSCKVAIGSDIKFLNLSFCASDIKCRDLTEVNNPSEQFMHILHALQ
jgi:hypothetical protein